MSFLGVDQSLNATGICVLDEDGGIRSLLTVKHKVGGASDVKLVRIRKAVLSATSGAVFGALEGYSYDSIHRAFDLGEVAGTVKTVLCEHAIPYLVVPPVILKMFATGSTRAEKLDMVTAAKAKGALVLDDDQADAFFLAHVARAFVRGAAHKRCEMEAIHWLKHPTTKKTAKRPRQLVKHAI